MSGSLPAMVLLSRRWAEVVMGEVWTVLVVPLKSVASGVRQAALRCLMVSVALKELCSVSPLFPSSVQWGEE